MDAEDLGLQRLPSKADVALLTTEDLAHHHALPGRTLTIARKSGEAKGRHLLAASTVLRTFLP
jgi:hypothetical protein